MNAERTGHTPVASTMPSMCSMLQFDTPTALTFPVLSSPTIAAHVSVSGVSKSRSTQPSAFCGKSPFPGLNATGQ